MSSVSSNTNAESSGNSLLRDFRFRYLHDVCSCILVAAASCSPLFLIKAPENEYWEMIGQQHYAFYLGDLSRCDPNTC